APAGAPVAAPAALAAPPGPGEPAAPLANVRVLLVDDEELIRSPMRRFLARRGASVSEARDGLEALDLLRAGLEPQVMLVDLRMPRMDGVELYARLQAEYGRLAERVLFLSGDITQLAGRALAEVPRDRVLVKPLELVELEQKIREFVNAAT
ncbi:MAG: response regulator, partial [Gemmatimonadales bacterium]